MNKLLFGGIVLSMNAAAQAQEMQLVGDSRLCVGYGSCEDAYAYDWWSEEAHAYDPFVYWNDGAGASAAIDNAGGGGNGGQESEATPTLIYSNGSGSASCFSTSETAFATGLGKSETGFGFRLTSTTMFRLDAELFAQGDGSGASVRISDANGELHSWITTKGEISVHEMIELAPGQYGISTRASTSVTLNDEIGDLSGSASHEVQWSVISDCVADIDGNRTIDGRDFFAYLDLFAAGDLRADLTFNGVIDANDFFAYLDAFAAGCG